MGAIDMLVNHAGITRPAPAANYSRACPTIQIANVSRTTRGSGDRRCYVAFAQNGQRSHLWPGIIFKRYLRFGTRDRFRKYAPFGKISVSNRFTARRKGHRALSQKKGKRDRLYSDEDWDAVIEVNLTSVFRLCRLAAVPCPRAAARDQSAPRRWRDGPSRRI